MSVRTIDQSVINFFRQAFLPLARIALFIVFFWFGILKLFDLSPASPLAQALTAQTVGLQYFDTLFKVLSLLECLIGVLFLVPKATRIVIPLLFIHMAVVCAPLLLVPHAVWAGFLIPTLEGQYIIKNVVIVAVAIGVAAQIRPLAK
jgi:uncharacterized membrane protein YkgB